jgi:HD-GYP domain-containing protein (c-di-GMP phosphodiesterase class II)
MRKQDKTPTFLPKWRISSVIATVMVVGMALMASALITLGWLGIRYIFVQTASSGAAVVGKITQERAHNLVDHAETLLSLLALDPITRAYTLNERLERIPSFLLILKDNPQATTVYAGYDNGDAFFVVQLNTPQLREIYHAPAGSVYFIRNIQQNSQQNGQQEDCFYLFADHHFEKTQSPFSAHYDPRTELWYRNAIQQKGAAVSQPYGLSPKPLIGITMSVRGAQAVVAIDLPLNHLSTTLKKIKLTPNSEIAVIDKNKHVIATNFDGNRQAMVKNNELDLPILSNQNYPILSKLLQKSEIEKIQTIDIDGNWFGQRFELINYGNLKLDLLVATPRQELLNDLVKSRNIFILFAFIFGALLLSLGWWIGRRLGVTLQQNIQRVKQMSSFDFSLPPLKSSVISEIHQLQEVTDDVSSIIQGFLNITQTLNSEQDVRILLDKVLMYFVQAIQCQSGAVYLYQAENQTWNKQASVGDQSQIEPVIAKLQAGEQLAEDRYAEFQSFTIYGRKQQILGYLLLQHAGDDKHTSIEFLEFSKRLTGMLAVSIETRQLIEAQKSLLDAFIQVLANAIDTKSPYTGGHCNRVPELALMMIQQLNASTEGDYADFHCEDDAYEAFRIAAWLHDCGKVTTPEHIVDKATKLEVIYNRIHEVRMRFEVMWRDAEINCFIAQHHGLDKATAEVEKHQKQQQLQDDFSFVAQCNVGGEFMSDVDITRLTDIAQQTWQRYFDRRLGMSIQELKQATATDELLPVTEQLLADKAEHCVIWPENRIPPVEKNHPDNHYAFDMHAPEYQQNSGELHNLSVRRGTLTAEDRFIINDHIVQTLIMLSKLPWPAHLQRIPDIASNHHEKMDGTGYPRRLMGADMSVEERVLALADVFEALTAADRPYKSTKTVMQSLIIMANMGKEHHLDVVLLRYFIQNELWKSYAEKYLLPNQIDEVDVDKLLKIMA